MDKYGPEWLFGTYGTSKIRYTVYGSCGIHGALTPWHELLFFSAPSSLPSKESIEPKVRSAQRYREHSEELNKKTDRCG
jgi:hypothetical protein